MTESDTTPAREECGFFLGCGGRRDDPQHAGPGMTMRSHPFRPPTPRARADEAEVAGLRASEVVRMLEGIKREVEVMGEDGECSLRTIKGVQYVTKDDVLLAVDSRLGVVRLRALAAQPAASGAARMTVRKRVPNLPIEAEFPEDEPEAEPERCLWCGLTDERCARIKNHTFTPAPR